MKAFFVAIAVALVASAGTATATSWINGRSIRPHSIPLNRLAHKPPRGPRGLQGVAGPQGPEGLPGIQGVPGAPGVIDLSKFVKILGPNVDLPAGTTSNPSISCPTGDRIVSSGFSQIIVGPPTDGFQVQGSTPHDNGTDWIYWFRNNSASDVTLRLYAICLQP